jgi:hypothetical protein
MSRWVSKDRVPTNLKSKYALVTIAPKNIENVAAFSI